MALADLLYSTSTKKIGLSEERVAAIVPVARKYIAYWREYPDMFVDFLCGRWKENEGQGPEEEDSKFKFYFYQRVFIRVAMRYKYTYMVFPRKVCAGGNGNIV